MRWIPAALVVLVLAARPASAQDVSCEKWKLDNGMTVILHEDHALPEAAINLWYRVGSKDEPARRSGFAHLFEHLMFMGTKRAPTGAFDAMMAAGGGSNNATTSEDRTNYFSHGPAELLPTLLWLDADRLEGLGAAMTQEKLDRQRDIVRNERRQTHENRPYGKAELVLQELMYPEGHPYHIPVIGTHEDLEAATVQDVKDFFATHYVPNNASLAIAGDFDLAKTKALVTKLFGAIARGGEAPHRTAPPGKLDGVIRSTVVDKVQLPRISIAYRSPALFADGDADMDLAASVLSQGKTSRLFKRLVYDEKIATTVRASQGSSELGSIFRIDVTTRAGADLDRVEKLVDEELARFLEAGPSSEELARRQAELEHSMLSRLQSVERVADKLNEYEAYFGEPNSFKRDLDRYRNATRESVRDRSREVLTPKARVILRVLPEGPAKGETPLDEKPVAEARKPFALEAPEKVKLSNGISVLVFPRPALPLIATTLLFKPGMVLGDPEGKKAGLASLTAQMLREGAGDLSALDFDEALQLLGARLSSGAGQESASVSLAVVRRNFEKAAGLMAKAVRSPRFDAEDWKRVKRLHQDGLRRRDDQPQNVASNVGNRLLYGDKNPFAWPSDGSPESVKALTLDDVKDEALNIFRPEYCTILVAGDITAADARAALEGLLGDWKAEPVTGRADPDVAIPAHDKLRVVFVDRPDAVQTLIRFQMPGPRYGDDRRVALRMFNNIFGGSFSSRLNQNLREAHGYTYGASSRFALEPSTGTFVASSSVRADVTGASLKEFLAEMKRIREGTITDAEASKACETLRAEAVHSTSELSGLVGIAGELIVNGLPFEAWGKDLARLDLVKAADLNALAKDAIPLEQGVLVLVGDRKIVLAAVKDLGLLEAVEVDARGQPK
jgi:predicted Zn-dependent peptidase